MAYPPDIALGFLRQAQERGQLAHAYLIDGLDGARRREFALALARQVNASTAASLDAMASEGVHLVEPQMKSRQIGIDQLRGLEHLIRQRSLPGRQKIGIIVEADRMTPQATNAFLKTLEEPPPDSLLLLLTGAPSRLLDTVVSRCIRLSLSLPEEAAVDLADERQERLAAGLAEHFSKPPTPTRALAFARTYSSLLAASKAAIGDACAAEQKREAARYDKTTDAGPWLRQRDEYFDALSNARYIESRNHALGLVFAWLGDLARRHTGHPRLAFPQYAAVIDRAAARLPVEEWLRRMTCLEDLQRAYETNVNEALATELAFLGALG